jgi:hypothetical protein
MHGLNNFYIAEHSQLEGSNLHVIEYRTRLFNQQNWITALETQHVTGILYGVCSNNWSRVGTHTVDGLDIGLDTGPSGGIKTGKTYNDWNRLGHSNALWLKKFLNIPLRKKHEITMLNIL